MANKRQQLQAARTGQCHLLGQNWPAWATGKAGRCCCFRNPGGFWGSRPGMAQPWGSANGFLFRCQRMWAENSYQK